MKRILKTRMRRTVLVSTKSGAAFRGVLFDQDGQALVLRDAAELDPRAEIKFVPADGEIVILIADVAYFQFV